jgi:hypothetical protein
VREHEVYAIGYPGDKTTHRRISAPTDAEPDEINLGEVMQRAKAVWQSAATRLDGLIEFIITRFRQAEPQQRVLYAAFAAVPLLLLIMLLASLARHGEVPAMPTRMAEQTASSAKPVLAIAPEAPVSAASGVMTKEAIQAHSQTVPKTGNKKKVEGKIAKEIPKAKPEDNPKPEHSENQTKSINNNGIEHNSTLTTSSGGTKSYISVTCVEGTDVFVDGIRKGRVGTSPLRVEISPGSHTVIVSHTSRGIFTQSVELSSGKTVHIKPSLCN